MAKTAQPQKILENLIVGLKDVDTLMSGNNKDEESGLQLKEALGVFLLSEAMNFAYSQKGENITFSILTNDGSDALNEDGAIQIHFNDESTSLVTYLEQVSVTSHQEGDINAEIESQLQKKNRKYTNEYYENRSLLVFIEKVGAISIEEVKAYLRTEHPFGFYSAFVLEKNEDSILTYAIVNLDINKDTYSKFFVKIDTDNKTYEVTDRDE